MGLLKGVAAFVTAPVWFPLVVVKELHNTVSDFGDTVFGSSAPPNQVYTPAPVQQQPQPKSKWVNQHGNMLSPQQYAQYLEVERLHKEKIKKDLAEQNNSTFLVIFGIVALMIVVSLLDKLVCYWGGYKETWITILNNYVLYIGIIAVLICALVITNRNEEANKI
jgi:hypothetical protein